METKIKIIRKSLNLTQQEFADKLNVKRGTISSYEAGKAEPSAAVLTLMCNEFNLNRHWWETGKGEMFLPATTEEEIAKFAGKILKSPDESFQKKFVKAVAKLTPDEWELIEKFIEKLAKKEDEQ